MEILCSISCWNVYALCLIHKLTKSSAFFFREAHIKNPNNKTVPEGVMQGLLYVKYFENDYYFESDDYFGNIIFMG